MPKKKSKANALKLLAQNTDPHTVAEQTGYSIRRIYDFKKELENTPKQLTEMSTEPAPLQLHNPQADSAVEAKLEKALDTLLEHLERDVSNDIIEGIIKMTEAINKLRAPPTNFAELINENPTNEKGTIIHTKDDAGQDTAGASPNATNFVDILERTAEGTKKTD